MRHDNEAWRSALDSLGSSDVAPEWIKANAWKSLETKLRPRSRRVIPLWTFPAAAAAAILLCIVLMRHGVGERGSGVAVHPAARAAHSGNIRSTKSVVAPVAVVRQPAIAAQPLSKKMVSPQPAPAAILPAPRHDTTASEIVTAPDTPAIHPETVAVAAGKIKRTPEVVYTLNEILADVPEREAPPRKYSGLFHSRSGTGSVAPQPVYPRRAMPDGDAPPSPIIIN